MTFSEFPPPGSAPRRSHRSRNDCAQSNRFALTPISGRNKSV